MKPDFFKKVFDLVFPGPSENGFEDLLKIFYDLTLSGSSKADISLKINEFHSEIKDPYTHSYEAIPSHSGYLTEKTEFSNTFLMELSRGCPYSCKFCTVPLSGKFFSFRPERINELIDNFSEKIDKFGLLFAGYDNRSKLKDIIKRIISLKKSISVSSLRADLLDEELAELLIKGGQRKFTLAPETGDDTGRRSTGKNISNIEFAEKTLMLYSLGAHTVRFYFMYGLPEMKDRIKQSEIPAEYCISEGDSIISFLKDIRKWTLKLENRREPLIIEAHLSPFIPMPLTPWQD
ncbi:MAG: radical SAM protein, partial [Actinomycetia bacterium]|nr:radical SAM protein [Actinomycetes bacterium]